MTQYEEDHLDRYKKVIRDMDDQIKRLQQDLRDRNGKMLEHRKSSEWWRKEYEEMKAKYEPTVGALTGWATPITDLAIEIHQLSKEDFSVIRRILDLISSEQRTIEDEAGASI